MAWFRIRFATVSLLAPLALASASPPSARAVASETFVLAIGGQSVAEPGFACTVFGPATPAIAFFSNPGPGVPIDGLDHCGIAGGFRTTTVPTHGPISDTTSLSTTFNSGANSFVGSSLALARSGSVLARAQATFTGPANGLLVEGAQTYATFDDTLTPASPSVAPGTNGTVRLRFTVSGSMSVAGPPPFASTADVELNYRVNAGPSFVLMRAQLTRADLPPFAIAGTGAPLVGFTSGAGSFAGSGEVDTFEQPFVWGSPFDLKFGLLAAAIPGTGGTATVDFSQAATLTGIQLFANGQPVHDFAIASASGTAYTANGVPEPGVASMLACGVAALAALAADGRAVRRSSAGSTASFRAT